MCTHKRYIRGYVHICTGVSVRTSSCWDVVYDICFSAPPRSPHTLPSASHPACPSPLLLIAYSGCKSWPLRPRQGKLPINHHHWPPTSLHWTLSPDVSYRAQACVPSPGIMKKDPGLCACWGQNQCPTGVRAGLRYARREQMRPWHGSDRPFWPHL